MATQPTSLLLSKLRPPGISLHSLRRHELIEELIGSSAKAILIEAPAGNGKTMLMEQVYGELRLRNVPTAWLTLDANDNDADEFVQYLVRTLLLAGVLDASDDATARGVRPGRSPQACVATLLAEAAAGGRQGVIFFDDIHRITGPACLALIRVLLCDSTNALRFVMASRRSPLLDAAKLRLQGTLDRVPAERLHFTLAEAAVFLGRNPTDASLRSVYDRTRGWPAAVRLLGAALPRFPTSARTLVSALSDLPDMAAYLSEQVMSDLAPDLERFLMMTSLPERITGDLANKLCDRADGEHTLRQLQRDGFFITQSADHRAWYRYHDFFRDFLCSRLAEQPGVEVAGLHRRAAEWFLAKGQLEEALKHALEAGAWDLAIMILENEGGWQIALKHGAEVLHGIEAIPAAAMQASLLTRLTLVYLLLHFGQADRAREGFEELRTESADFTQWRGEAIAATVRAECHALEAIIIIDEERPLPVSFVERVKQEACAVGARGRFVRIVTDGLTIYANYDAGNYRECVRLAEQGFLALKDINANFGLGYLHLYLGMSHFALGRLHLAQTSYREALDLAATHFPHESQRIEALACIAECQYYANDLAGARCNVDAALASLRDQVAVDGPVFQVTYLTAAAVYARSEELDNALSLLLEARAVAQYLQREHRLAHIDIRRVEELTRAGYCADAEEIIQQDGFQRALAGSIGDPSCIPLLAMNASLALARFELAARDPAVACQRLLALEAKSEEYQHEILKLKCLTLLIACQFALGDHAAGMRGLRRLGSRIIPLGLKRVIADEKAFIQPAFEYAIDKAERAGTAPYVNAQIIREEWLKARNENAHRARTEESASSGRPVKPLGVLSPRQREVLELLAAGLSGKEIATRLGLSESTVKSYRKSLYARLRAARRSQALANARRMSLLP